MSTAGVLEEGRSAAAPGAEVEVVAGDDSAGVQPPDQDLGHEGLCRHGGERGIEGEHRQPVHAEALGETRLQPERCKPEDRGRAGEIVARMRFEGEHRRRHTARLCEGAGAHEHGFVAAVQAVEIA